MKKVLLLLVGGCLMAGAVFAQETVPPPKEKAAAPASANQQELQKKGSYCAGLQQGRSLRKQGLPIDAQEFARGLVDGLTAADIKLSDKELEATLAEFTRLIEKLQIERQQKQAELNKKEGAAFLAANQAKEGVKTLPSGLQYKVLKSGKGPSPKVDSTVTTHYRGTLLDGTVFDSSYDRGEPIEFPVDGVIAGWTEALQLMKVGDKWQLFIPSELAYGETGAGGGEIGPNAVLVFEIELLSFK